MGRVCRERRRRGEGEEKERRKRGGYPQCPEIVLENMQKHPLQATNCDMLHTTRLIHLYTIDMSHCISLHSLIEILRESFPRIQEFFAVFVLDIFDLPTTDSHSVPRWIYPNRIKTGRNPLFEKDPVWPRSIQIQGASPRTYSSGSKWRGLRISSKF